MQKVCICRNLQAVKAFLVKRTDSLMFEKAEQTEGRKRILFRTLAISIKSNQSQEIGEKKELSPSLSQKSLCEHSIHVFMTECATNNK